MATRSLIAVDHADEKKVEAIYCHWDGYPDNNARILTKYYDSYEKASLLMETGGVSSLKPEILESDCYNDTPEVFPYTNQDKIWRKLAELSDNYGAEYIYLYNDNMWMYISVYEPEEEPRPCFPYRDIIGHMDNGIDVQFTEAIKNKNWLVAKKMYSNLSEQAKYEIEYIQQNFDGTSYIIGFPHIKLLIDFIQKHQGGTS